MKKNIYDYLVIVEEAKEYFFKKYNLDYEYIEDICLQFLLVYLSILEENKIVRNHFRGLYLTKLDEYLRVNRGNLGRELKIKKEGLSNIEAIVNYLCNIKKYPLYKVSDLLNIDGYAMGNILDSIDFKRKM